MSALMHAWPKRDGVTSCCGRTRVELPLADGLTTDDAGVTCDGTFEPAVYAHEVYPEPDWAATVGEAAKYHAARALAMTEGDIDHPNYMMRLQHMLAERTIAWHVAALDRGLSREEALRWVHVRDQDETNELLYELCVDLGVDLTRIRRYGLGKVQPIRDGEQTP